MQKNGMQKNGMQRSSFAFSNTLNPLKRVNLILTLYYKNYEMKSKSESQSPQTGQFNSYKPKNLVDYGSIQIYRLNPLKRVNSILTSQKIWWIMDQSKSIVSIPSNGSIQFLHYHEPILEY